MGRKELGMRSIALLHSSGLWSHELSSYLRSNLRKAHKTRDSLNNSGSQLYLVYSINFVAIHPWNVHHSRRNTKTLYFRGFKVIQGHRYWHY